VEGLRPGRGWVVMDVLPILVSAEFWKRVEDLARRHGIGSQDLLDSAVREYEDHHGPTKAVELKDDKVVRTNPETPKSGTQFRFRHGRG